MYKSIITEIERLSQEEGLFDDEIAKELECSRATVNRIRNKYEIPGANLRNRKDKSYTCVNCHKLITVRRYERRKLYCPDCHK